MLYGIVGPYTNNISKNICYLKIKFHLAFCVIFSFLNPIIPKCKISVLTISLSHLFSLHLCCTVLYFFYQVNVWVLELKYWFYGSRNVPTFSFTATQTPRVIHSTQWLLDMCWIYLLHEWMNGISISNICCLSIKIFICITKSMLFVVCRVFSN